MREYLLAKWIRACAYCGATGVPLNIDHIRPRSRGGSNRVSNLCTACIPCNQAKCNRPVEEFLGHMNTIDRIPHTVLIAAATERGTYARTRTDRYGFPRLRLPRAKRFFGFATGDLVHATVPTGRWAGTHTGRVAVRSSGSHTVTTPAGAVKTSRRLRLHHQTRGAVISAAARQVRAPLGPSRAFVLSPR